MQAGIKLPSRVLRADVHFGPSHPLNGNYSFVPVYLPCARLDNRILGESAEDVHILLQRIGAAADAVRASVEVVPVRQTHPDADGFSQNGVISRE